MNEIVLNQIFEIEKNSFPSDYWSLSSIRDSINDNSYYFDKILDGETVVGYVFFKLSFDEAELVKIAINNNYRNLGHAYALLNKSIDQLRVKDIKKIFLEVRSSNDIAIKLYRSIGFEQIGSRKNFYHNPIEDAIIMKLEFWNVRCLFARNWRHDAIT